MRYIVRCGDWRSIPHQTLESAQQHLESIVEMGSCDLDHEIIEVPGVSP